MNTPTPGASALIPITQEQIDGQTANTVNAKDLHDFLEVKTQFKDWIARRIEDFGFIENQDFCSFLSESTGGRPTKEYHLTLDMAKELSMVERNDKGKEARLYFLACERQAKQTIDPMTCLNDPAAMRGLLLTYTTKVLDLQATVAEQAPKVAALDLIATADGSTCITDTAKTLQIHPKVLFAWLSANQWIYRRTGGKGWVAYQNRLQQGLLEHKVTVVTRGDGTQKTTEQVLVTPKGLTKLAGIFALEVAA